MSEPTPERLREWAEWYDNPNECPDIVVEFSSLTLVGRLTAGFILRRLADAHEKALPRSAGSR